MKFTKVKTYIYVIAFFLSTLVSLAAAQPGHKEKLGIWTQEWPPYVIKNDPVHGLTGEILMKALDAVGLEAHFFFEPWIRCETMVRSGFGFAAFPYSVTPERQQFALFSKPLITSSTVFFYMQDKLGYFDYKGPDSLKPYRIGGTKGYFYESMFKQAGLFVDYAVKLESAFKKLHLSQVDLVPENEIVGWRVIEQLFPNHANSFRASRTPLKSDFLCLMVSKKYPGSENLLKQINAGLYKIIKDGAYGAILEKYNFSKSGFPLDTSP